MILLDTDHISLIARGGEEGQRILTLLTRNLTDFNKVPNLRAEDWSL